jgi:hypothetical protein
VQDFIRKCALAVEYELAISKGLEFSAELKKGFGRTFDVVNFALPEMPKTWLNFGFDIEDNIQRWTRNILSITLLIKLRLSVCLSVRSLFKLRFWEIRPDALEALCPDLWKRSINGASSGFWPHDPL